MADSLLDKRLDEWANNQNPVDSALDEWSKPYLEQSSKTGLIDRAAATFPAVWKGIKTGVSPQQLGGHVARVLESGKPAEATNTLDTLRENADQALKQFRTSPEALRPTLLGTTGEVVGDIAPQMPQTLEGLAGGLVGAARGAQFGPLGAIAGGVIGGLPSLLPAYHESQTRTAQEVEAAENQKRAGQGLAPLSLPERQALEQRIEPQTQQIAGAEIGTELPGMALEAIPVFGPLARLGTKPLASAFGREALRAGGTAALKAMGATALTEPVEEATSRMLQQPVEKELGLTQDPAYQMTSTDDWQKAFGEVTAPTLRGMIPQMLLGGGIGGVGAVRAGRQAYDRNVALFGGGEEAPAANIQQGAADMAARLQAKQAGTPATLGLDEAGQPVELPAVPPQKLDREEQGTLDYLQQNANDPAKLAERFGLRVTPEEPNVADDEMVATPPPVSTPVVPAPPEALITAPPAREETGLPPIPPVSAYADEPPPETVVPPMPASLAEPAPVAPARRTQKPDAAAIEPDAAELALRKREDTLAKPMIAARLAEQRDAEIHRNERGDFVAHGGDMEYLRLNPTDDEKRVAKALYEKSLMANTPEDKAAAGDALNAALRPVVQRALEGERPPVKPPRKGKANAPGDNQESVAATAFEGGKGSADDGGRRTQPEAGAADRNPANAGPGIPPGGQVASQFQEAVNRAGDAPENAGGAVDGVAGGIEPLADRESGAARLPGQSPGGAADGRVAGAAEPVPGSTGPVAAERAVAAAPLSETPQAPVADELPARGQENTGTIWDSTPPEQREAQVAKAGWGTPKGKISPNGKKLAQKPWSEIKPEQRKKLEAASPKPPDVKRTPANSWVIDNARSAVDAVRQTNPSLLTSVTDLHADDLNAAEIAQRLGINKELVADIRLGLGLPNQGKGFGGAAITGPSDDQEERARFFEWAAEHKRNREPTETLPAPVDGAMTKAVMPTTMETLNADDNTPQATQPAGGTAEMVQPVVEGADRQSTEVQATSASPVPAPAAGLSQADQSAGTGVGDGAQDNVSATSKTAVTSPAKTDDPIIRGYQERNANQRVITHDGKEWYVQGVGHERDGKTFLHLASTTEGRQQKNGWNPIQINDWVDNATLDAAAPKEQPTTPEQSSAAEPQWVEHVTGKGKTLRGIVRKDITVQQAKQIDPFTFRKDGGFFIRDKHVLAEQRDGIEVQDPKFITPAVAKAFREWQASGEDLYSGTDGRRSYTIEDSAVHDGLVEFGTLSTQGSARSAGGQKQFQNRLFFRKSDLEQASQGQPNQTDEPTEMVKADQSEQKLEMVSSAKPDMLQQRVEQIRAKIEDLTQKQEQAQSNGNAWVYDKPLQQAREELTQYEAALNRREATGKESLQVENAAEGGMTLEQARADLAGLEQRLKDQGPVSDARLGDKVRQYRKLVSEMEAEQVRPTTEDSSGVAKTEPAQSTVKDSLTVEPEPASSVVNDSLTTEPEATVRDSLTVEPEPAAAALNAEKIADLKAQLGQAIGELASILGAKTNMMPEEETRIIPVMSKIFRVAAELGYLQFKDAGRFVMRQIRELAGSEVADKLSIDNLQAGYINIASEIGGDKKAALGFDSIDELMAEAASDKTPNLTDTSAQAATQEQDNGIGERESLPAGDTAGGAVDRQNRPADSGPVDAGLAGAGAGVDQDASVPAGAAGTDGGGTGRPGRKRRQLSQRNREGATGGTESGVSAAGGLTEAPNPAASNTDDYQIDAEDIGKGGLTRKYRDNVQAIRILKTLEQEQRPATVDERKALARYVGWGAMKGVFDPENRTWAKQYRELKELLTPDEYAAARASTRNAHYTSPAVVKAMYDGVQRLGFQGGFVLEPAMGSGNFFGLMPNKLRSASKLHGVELDRLTSQLAQALYPNAVIAGATGFQDYAVPGDYFDLTIGNPPFGNETITERSMTGRTAPYSGQSIHNYFLARMIDKTREGGIVAAVVSHSFLDVANNPARDWIAQRANLLGAMRLPNTAFKGNAGTEVVTDILFFQKTATPEANPDWLQTGEQALKNAEGELKPVTVNMYFAKRPERVLGQPAAKGTMYRADEYTVDPAADWEQRLSTLAAELPAGVYQKVERSAEELNSADNTIPEGVKEESFYLTPDGEVRQRGQDVAGQATSKPWQPPNGKARERMAGMIRLRELLKQQLRLERDPDATSDAIEANRKKLVKQYRAFHKAHGFLNNATNRRLFAHDTESALVQALEFDYDKGVSKAVAEKESREPSPEKATEADILNRRVAFPPSEVLNVASARDALLASLNSKGALDLDYMRSVYDVSEAELLRELGDMVYRDPLGEQWRLADEYLSGDVKTKLTNAQQAAESDPAYQRNVKALEKVIPADKLPSQIYAALGASWIPGKHIEAFAREISGATGLQATWMPSAARWAVDFDATGNPDLMTNEFGTGSMSSLRILERLLNNKPVEVKTKDSQGNPVTDESKTEEAKAKADKIRAHWEGWIYRDPERASDLASLYNDKFNRVVSRGYNGEHLSLPGITPAVSLRQHQKDAVWRGIQDRNMLLDHVVGAGKTFAIVATTLEWRRLGIARKPLVIVPNHLTQQWKSDYYRLYPGSNVLAAEPDDFQKENRERLFGKIATGDWDAVIIGHSSLTKLGLSPELEAKFLQQQMFDITQAIEEMKRERGDKRVIADMEKIKINLASKINDLQNKAGERDRVLHFDELGVDAMIIDEHHEFKNLFFTTQKQRIAGLGNPKGSGKAFDLFMKIRWLQERFGENAPLITATGTPVSNTIAEMFTMQRYMRYDELKRMGLHLFDAWAGLYGKDAYKYEVAPSGVGYRFSLVFSDFQNMPSLMSQYQAFADTITLGDLKAQAAARGERFPVPKMVDDKPVNIVAQRSKLQRDYFGFPTLVRDAAGTIQYQINDPSAVVITQNDKGGFVVQDQGRQIGKVYETKEEAELAVVEASLTPMTVIDPKSIVGQFENLRQLTKQTKGRINALSLTGLAAKAGLDMRLINASAPDHPGSKINLAIDQMMKLYQEWEADKGAQLVFCDLSVPASARASAASQERYAYMRAEAPTLLRRKATLHTLEGYEGFPMYLTARGQSGQKQWMVYDAVSGREVLYGRPGQPKAEVLAQLKDELKNEAFRDRLWDLREYPGAITQDMIDEFRDAQGIEAEDGTEITLDELEGMAASSKFSVYDDMKAKLIQRGVPAHQIAFIHDFHTPKKKAELFQRVKTGEVRFLFGSTPKLGAGTNVQDRLVGLHHIDAPWRPSDLEQREGRILRQGNKLYERDPDGFRVLVARYATEQTNDTRRWQILERKASSIEQIRHYDGALSIEDVGGEASNAADMKAAASGNPLILEETRLRNEVRRLVALRNAHQDAQYRAKYQRDSAEHALEQSIPEREALYQGLIDASAAYPAAAGKDAIAEFKLDGKAYTSREKALQAVQKTFDLLSTSLAESETTLRYRGLDFILAADGRGRMVAESPTSMLKAWSVGESFSPSGFLTRLNNYIDALPDRMREFERQKTQARASIELANRLMTEPFADAETLTRTEAEHARVRRRLAQSTALEAVPADEKQAFMNEREARLAQLRNLGYGEAVKEAEGNQEEAPKFSRGATTKTAYDQRIDELFNGGKPVYGADSAVVLDRSDVLGMLGYSDGRVYLAEGKVIKGQQNHKLRAEHWKKVPEWLDNPALVFNSDTVEGRLVVVAPELVNGDPVFMILEPKADGVEINMLVNAYDRESKTTPFRRWVNDGELRYFDKKISPAVLARSGLQLSGLANARGRSGKVLRNADLFKYRAENKLGDDIRFSRPADSRPGLMAGGSDGQPVRQAKDQTAAEALNAGMVRYFKDKNWSNAYVQVELPDAVSGFREAVKSGFGKELVGVIGRTEGAQAINGVNYAGRLYVNVNADVGFVQLGGHELLHQLKRDRPDLYAWFANQASRHIRGLEGYQAKLNALLKPGEDPYNREAAKEELLGDFAGDAFADPKFVEKLAKADPGRFKALLNAVINWLKEVGRKLAGKGLGSSQYFKEVETLREHLANALVAYAQGGAVAVGKMEGMKFHTAWHGGPHDFDKFSSSKIGAGEGSQAFGYGLYFSNAKEIAEHYRNWLGGQRVSHWEMDGQKVKTNSRLARFLSHHRIDAQGSTNQLAADLREVNIAGYEQTKREALRMVEEGRLKPVASKGRLYQVELAPKEDEYLDWHKPLSEQSEKVRAALGVVDTTKEMSAFKEFKAQILAKYGSLTKITPEERSTYDALFRKANPPKQDQTAWNTRGGDLFYRATAERLGSDQAASEYLHSLGIRGIRYPAEGQTGGKTGDRFNFVIFSDEDVEITAKFSRSRKPARSNTPSPFTGDVETLFADADASVRQAAGAKQAARELEKAGNKLAGAARRQWLGALTVHQLVDIGKRLLPRLNDYLRDMTGMDVTRNGVLHEVDEVVKVWEQLPAQDLARLAHVMHESTLASIDGAEGQYKPSIDLKEAGKQIAALKRRQLGAGGDERIAKWQEEIKQLRAQVAYERKRLDRYGEIQALYDALSEPAKAVYVAARDYHVEQSKRVEAALVEMIRRSLLNARQKAAAITKLRKDFEAQRVQAPYFPLGRDGDYWVSVSPAPGEQGEPAFVMFDTIEEQEQAIADYKTQGLRINGRGKRGENLQQVMGVSSSFVADVETLIGTLGDGPAVEAVRDQVYQLYLRTLPELSTRKHFIHRKKTAGFGADALKAFAKKGYHDAYQYARVKHGFDLRHTMEALEKDLKAASGKTAYRAAKRELAHWQTFKDEVLDGGMDLNAVKARADFMDARAVDVREAAGKRDLTPGERFVLAEADDWKRYVEHMRDWAKYGGMPDKVSREIRDLTLRLDTAKRIIAEPRGYETARNYAMELQQAYEHLMHPHTSAGANLINQIGYLWHMAFSPAAWITNATQTPLITMPYVASRFGLAKTTKAFDQARRDAMRGAGKDVAISAKKAVGLAKQQEPVKEHALGIRESLTDPNEIDAYEQAMERGLIERGRAMDLAGVAEEGAARSGWHRKFAIAMTVGFHDAERLNREVSYMASYRLARAEGLTHDAAVTYAGKVINDTHFNYTAENRPRFLRSDLMRVLGQFKLYSQHITYLQWRALKQALGQNASAEERSEARRFLLMQTGIQLMAGGVLGLPLGIWATAAVGAGGMAAASRYGWPGALGYAATVIAAAVALTGDDEDDPKEWEAEFQQMMAEWLGQTGGEGVSKGLVNALAGIDLSSRVSQGELWWRSLDADLDDRELWGEVLSQIAGAGLGTGASMVQGLQMASDGHVERGIEKMVPKAIKDVMQSLRFTAEDAKTLKGDVLVEDFAPWELASKAVGFTPSRLTQRYAENSAEKRRQRKIEERRRELTGEVAQANIDAGKARRSGDAGALKTATELRDEAMAKVRTFNETQPAFAITAKTLKQSAQARLRARDMAKNGVFLNRKIPERYNFATE